MKQVYPIQTNHAEYGNDLRYFAELDSGQKVYIPNQLGEFLSERNQSFVE